jgi:uncharacterized protein
MSAFQIKLDELKRGPVEKSVQPTKVQLEDLFSAVLGNFRLLDVETFGAELRAQLSDSTIHVSGHVEGGFSYDCGRCLSQRTLEIDTDCDFVLMSESEWSNAYADEDEIALKEDEMDVSYYEGNLIDLADLIREVVLLEIPTYARCPEDLRQQCDALYEERVGDETLEELEEQKVDLRWGPLKDLKVTDSGEVKRVDEDESSKN